MAASSTRTPIGIAQSHPSFIDSGLALSLKFLLPFVFYTLLIMSGTISIIYTFYVHQQVPRNFIRGFSITFGLVLLLTAALLFLFRIRRCKQRGAIEDEEANRPDGASSAHKAHSKPKTRPPRRDNDEQVLPVEPEPVYELNPRGSTLPSSSREGRSIPSELPHRSFKPRAQNSQGSLAEGLSSNPPSAMASPPTSANLQDSGVLNISSVPTSIPRRPLRGSDRLKAMESPRRHRPPPTKDYPTYHKPIYDPPATLPSSMNTSRNDPPTTLPSSMSTSRRSTDRRGRV